MALDDLFLKIGELGRYQWFLVILASIGTFVNPITLFSQFFFTVYTPHWCRVDWWNGDECARSGMDAGQCKDTLKELTIPWTEEDGYSGCYMYNVTEMDISDTDYSFQNRSSIGCPNGRDFDESETGRTLTAKYDLVCEREDLIYISQSLYFLGSLIGSPIYGRISDRFGRLIAWAICLTQSLALAVTILFINNFWLFTALRMLISMSNYCLWIIPFVYITEVVGYNKRMFVGIFVEFFWAGGYLFITSLAWAFGDWIYIQITVIVVHVLTYPILLLLCESPRWLLAVGKVEKAEKVVKLIAKRNGREMPDNYREDLLEERKKIEEEAEAGHKVNYLEIIQNRTIATWTMIFVVIWTAHGLTYFALTFISGDLGFEFYPSFFIQAAVEVPAYLLCIILLSYVGRRPSMSFFMLAGGAFCILAIFVPLGIWKAVVVFAAKFCISISFVVMFVYTVEIYPTCVRNFALSILVVISLIGDIVSPLTLIVAYYWEPFPLTLCGTVTIAGGILTLLLPETRGTMLPETIEEAVYLGKKKPRDPTDDDKTPDTCYENRVYEAKNEVE